MAGLAEKFTSLMTRPGQDPNDDQPWYLKYGARVLGIIGAFFCILFGLWNCLSIIAGNLFCLVSGIFQMILGFVVMGVEAPFCCMFVDYVQQVAEKVDQRPLWNRAAVYCGLSLVPILLCFSLASIFACGLVFGCGVIYGMMGLGKKATAEEMRRNAAAAEAAAAAASAAANQSTFSPTTDTRSNLVKNAQPISVFGPPPYDSNA